MHSNRLTALEGALIADALSMPVHWYYDRLALRRDYGRVDSIRPANYISRVDKRCDIVGGCVTRSLSTTARLLPSRQHLPNRALYCTGAVRKRNHSVGVNSAADFTPLSPGRVSW